VAALLEELVWRLNDMARQEQAAAVSTQVKLPEVVL